MWTIEGNCESSSKNKNGIKKRIGELDVAILEIRKKAKIIKYHREKKKIRDRECKDNDAEKISFYQWWSFDIRGKGDDTRSDNGATVEIYHLDKDGQTLGKAA